MRTNTPKARRQSVEAYLAFDNDANTNHEYMDGEISEMATASYEHNLIVSNLLCTLGNQMIGTSFMVMPSGTRVSAAKSDFYLYPDVVVYDSAAALLDPQGTLSTPTLLIEVLSPSTELKDRGVKFNKYQQIPTLKTYILISQEVAYIEVFSRQKGNLWLYSSYEGVEAATTLPSINAMLHAAEVYQNVDFPPLSDEPERDDP